jgi:cobalt-precorrin 5A hydrolase
MDREEAMIVAGLGFRSGVTPEELLGILTLALAQARLAPDRLGRLATAASRAAEPAYQETARQLGLEAVALDDETLRGAAGQVRTMSPRVLARYRVGSIAEAAALAGAGPKSELILARIASPRATCALARALSGEVDTGSADATAIDASPTQPSVRRLYKLACAGGGPTGCPGEEERLHPGGSTPTPAAPNRPTLVRRLDP